jgi:hypothetical protein
LIQSLPLRGISRMPPGRLCSVISVSQNAIMTDLRLKQAFRGHFLFFDGAPPGTPWMWTIASRCHEGRTPTHGCGARTLLCRHSLARVTGDEADVSQAYSQRSPLRASRARQRSRPREPAHQLVAGRTLGRVVVDEVLGCPAFIFRTSLSISRQVSHST